MSLITKLRKPRIGPFAIFDFVASYAGIYFGSPLVKKYLSRSQLLYLTIPLGVLIHAILGIKTPLNKMVIGPDGNILARVLVAAMILRAISLGIKPTPRREYP